MPIDIFSVLMSATYRCNADCDYCYENKTSEVMELEDFERILQRIVDWLPQQEISELHVYWQGGDILTMTPEWFLRAHDIIRNVGESSEIKIESSLQTNLLGFTHKWRRVISEMFNDEIGSSLDFPNLYRKVTGQTPRTFNDTWLRRYKEARDAGIQVGIIAVLNGGSLSIGAHEFYGYYTEQLGLNSFQVNNPYPGGHPTPAKRNFPLNDELLSAFYNDLFGLWMLKGRPAGVSITPFDQMIRYFLSGENGLSCCHAENCAKTFIGISPKGNVSQCEGFAASYPEYVFGNILTCENLAEIMNSPVRRQFLDRPARLMEEEDCAECEFLPLCHGGCPVHAYATTGSIFRKEPNCRSHKMLFRLARDAAIEIDRKESAARTVTPEAACA